MAAHSEDSSARNASTLRSDRSQSIREAALRLFSTNGYPSVSLRQLAESIGIQVGSLYNHMENKQELLFDLVEEAEYILLSNLEQTRRGSSVAAERLTNYIQCHLRHIYEHRNHHTLATRDAGYLSSEQMDIVLGIRRKQLNILRDILLHGNAQKSFLVSDIMLTASAIRALLEGVVNHLAASNITYDYAKGKIGPLILCAVGCKRKP